MIDVHLVHFFFPFHTIPGIPKDMGIVSGTVFPQPPPWVSGPSPPFPNGRKTATCAAGQGREPDEWANGSLQRETESVEARMVKDKDIHRKRIEKGW